MRHGVVLAIVAAGGIAALIFSRASSASVNAGAPITIYGLNQATPVTPDQTYTTLDTTPTYTAPAANSGGSFLDYFLNISADPFSSGVDMRNNFQSALAGPGATYAPIFAATEAQYGIPGQYLARIGYRESRFQAAIIDGTQLSSAGALGIMQILPRAHPDISIGAILNPAQAIPYAGAYLARLFNKFGDWSIAVGAYNMGEGNMGHVLDGTYPVTKFPTALAYVAEVTGGDLAQVTADNMPV